MINHKAPQAMILSKFRKFFLPYTLCLTVCLGATTSFGLVCYMGCALRGMLRLDLRLFFRGFGVVVQVFWF